MAAPLVALGIQTPQVNALSAMAEGQQAGQRQQMNQIQIAQQNLAGIAQMANDIGGDPAKWEQGLDMLEQAGLPVQSFRGRADLAPLVAKSAFTAAEQVGMAQDQQTYELNLRKFEQELQQAAAGPKPTANMQDFAFSQENPGFAEFMGKGSDGKPVQIVETFDPATGQPVKGYMDGTTFVPVGGAKAASNGLTVTTNPDGTTTVQQGGAPKPLTEGQSKDTVYATRAEGALPILDQFGSALMNPVERAVEGDPTGIARGMQSPEFQQAQQAGKEFLQAILRKDTGAAITPQETAEYGTVYLPVPGDLPVILEQKRLSRVRALEAIKAGLPPQAILAQEQALANTNATAAPPTAAAAAPAGEPAKPMSQADYDAIPSGGLFIDPDDGQTYKKP